MGLLDWLNGSQAAEEEHVKTSGQLSEDRWVKANVWKSKNASGQVVDNALKPIVDNAENMARQKLGQKEIPLGNVGHAAVEVQNTYKGYCYGSFWPYGGLSKNPKETLPSNYSVGLYERTYEQDVDLEEGEPEISPTFFSLDSKAVVDKHKELKEQAKEYVLKSKTNPQYRDEKTENCSTFAYQMLKAGGINQLSKKCSALEGQLYALTPDKLGECVRDAKRAELEQYPETHDFEPHKIHP